MGKFVPKLVCCLVFFLLVTAPSGGRRAGAEIRAQFRCPRMIDCNQVCQGYPNRCVDGQCICDDGNDSPPAQAHQRPNQVDNCYSHSSNCNKLDPPSPSPL